MPYAANSNVLYFPSIEVRSLDWLKSALLVWDHVYRIVPEGFVVQESASVREAVDADLLRSVTPETEDRSEARDDFKSILEAAATVPDGFTDDDGLVLVHTGKVDERLGPLLESAGGILEGDWFNLPRGLARGYVLNLSRIVARRRGLSLSTDSPDAWVASAYLEAEGNVDDYAVDPAAKEYYCHLNIQDVFPVNVADVDMRSLVKFASARKEEKRALREEIATLQNKLAQCESTEFATTIVADARDAFTTRMQDYRASIRTLGFNDLASSLVVGVPTTMAALAFSPNPFESRVLIPGVAIGATCALVDAVRARRIRQHDLIGGYLAGLKAKALNGVVGALPGYMNEFVND